jgi:hypothetical protein
MSSVIVYYAGRNERSVLCAKAMRSGIMQHEQNVLMQASLNYHHPDHDIAVFYGLAEGLRRVFDDYVKAGRKVVFVDMGYWNRRKRGRFDGYHKISVNDRHPTAYFQDRKHTADRLKEQGIKIAPWREKGRHIVVVGMSAKAALHAGFQPHQWERETIEKLKKMTKRPIIYRPKPNWLAAHRFQGVGFMKTEPLEQVLAGAHCVVAHHSNVAVDAILAGIPAICPGGVASVMAGHDLTQVESPPMPEGREQWAADIAYCQWSLGEMASGRVWQHLKREGLLK